MKPTRYNTSDGAGALARNDAYAAVSASQTPSGEVCVVAAGVLPDVVASALATIA